MKKTLHEMLDSVLLAVALLTPLCVFFNPFQLPNRGYICGDPKISYKYQENTVSSRFIIIYQQIIAYFFIWFVEFTLAKNEDVLSKLKSSRVKAHKWFRDFMYAWSLMLTFLIIAKSICGENRPHFLDMCQPDAVNCKVGSLVTNFTCTNQNLSKLRLLDISTSFPSGHAALAVHFSMFACWFLQNRLPKMRAKFFVPFLQAILAYYALFCCTTRISDNAHHPNDVLFGLLIGVAFCIFHCFFISENFKIDQSVSELTKLEIEGAKSD